MDKRYIISLQGRDFVTYEGLLDEAHARGLTHIRTHLVQVPSEGNGQTAICTAEVELERDGAVRSFAGIGDANPRNVSRAVAPHLIRLAETRAKARALRDAINVGMTAVEELEEGEMSAARPVPLASRAQIERASREMRRTGLSQEAGRSYLQTHFGKVSRLELTGPEIEQFIAHLEGLAEAVTP